jgi:23S rRNA G2445 N2-methylase RlmL
MPPRAGTGPERRLSDRVRDPGFTPSVRDVPVLVDLLADEDLAKSVERAIGRVGVAALPTLRECLARARPPLRGRIVNAVARLGVDPAATRVLVDLLADAHVDPKTRRNAAIALGKRQDPAAAKALEEAWLASPDPAMRRTLAASLGKTGGPQALVLLADAAATTDPELARIAARATIMIERTASRGAEAGLDAARPPPRPIDVVLTTRRGLEGVLAEELIAVGGVDRVQAEGAGRVRAVLAAPLASLFAARTWADVHFPVAGGGGSEGEMPPRTVARALASDAARAVLETWSVGAVRYRIAWVYGGHRRAATWEAVRAIAQTAPALVNDPTASTWEVRVAMHAGGVEVALSPRALDDPRFSWRRKDVPAASHPTVSAALARIAGVEADDVVWDPFCGSAGELIERARLGPYRALHGTDVDPRALDAARANLKAAGVEATLTKGDSLTHVPRGVTLMLTNPPMGRRSLRTAGTREMLDAFTRHAARVLVPGGRLVWIAPWPERTRRTAERAGMVLERARTIDMGGFEAEFQRWRRA